MGKNQLVTEVFNARSVVQTLEKLMNDVTKDDCNPKTVNAACNCAARITDIIRLHIEASKIKTSSKAERYAETVETEDDEN